MEEGKGQNLYAQQLSRCHKTPQRKQWSEAIRRDMVSLREHDVYELVAINRVPKGQKTIGSRFVFKQTADG